MDDIDLYRIRVADPPVFSVSFSGSLSVDNDASLFLFDATGSLVLFDADSGAFPEPAFLPGVFAAGVAGEYFLGIGLFDTMPAFDPLTGWNRDPLPFQTGPYTLTLTGAAPVPEPSQWLAIGSLGLVAFAGYRRIRPRV